MLNRKGQSLVLFILLLPIMLGIMVLVIDCGNAFVLKSHIDHSLELVLEIALDKEMDDVEISNLLKYNLEGVNNKLIVSDKEIKIVSSTEYKGVFSKVFGFSFFPIHSEYVGSIQNDKVVIDKKK